MMEKEHKVRLIDLAKLCNTSVAVVSQVLNGGHNNIGVSLAKAELIRKTAEEMHYQPNLLARSLVGRRSHLVGAFLDSMAPSFYNRVLASLFLHLQTRGYHLLISEGHDSITQLREAYSAFQQYGIAGMVVLAHNYGTMESLDFLDYRHTVFLGIPDKPNGKEYVVNVDNAASYAAGFKHLYEKGKRRIGLLVPQIYSHTVSQRKAGFLQQKELLGDKIETALIFEYGSQDITPELLQAQFSFVMSNRLDGLLMLNDVHAAGFCHYCFQHNVPVPQDIAIIGEGDQEFSSFTRPSLTTIHTDSERCGQSLAELVISLQSPTPPPPCIEVITPTLIIRESTAF